MTSAFSIPVGYANDTIDQFDKNSSLITPQFIGIGTEGKIALTSIKCPEEAHDAITLFTLNGDGTAKKSYSWTRKRDGGWKYGWMDTDDDSGEFVQGVFFDPGEAFWVQNDGTKEDGFTFQSSGEVNKNDVEFILAYDKDSAICGNCTPVNVDLQDLTCQDEAHDMVTLFLLNGDGTSKKSYSWTRKRDDGWKYGWMDTDDDSGEFIQGVSFKPGQGFWVQNDGTKEDGFTLTIPGVEL